MRPLCFFFRSKQFLNPLQDTQSIQTSSVQHWCRAGSWPKEFFAMTRINPRTEMLARPRRSRKRSNAGTVRDATDSDTSSTVGEKSSEYESNNYHRKLAAEGFYMLAMESNTPPGPRDDESWIAKYKTLRKEISAGYMKRHEQARGHMIMVRGLGAHSSDQAILIWGGLWDRNCRYWRYRYIGL